MMARRQYSDADKAAALAALDANRGNVNATATALGIPNSTLDAWSKARGVNAAVPGLVEYKKGDLADQLQTVAQQLVGAMADKIHTANLQQVATALGITIDKMQLLRGESTDNAALRIRVEYADPDAS